MKIDSRFHVNRLGQVALTKQPHEKNVNEIFREVKARRQDLIRAHNITDLELRALITRIKSGIRNVTYLAVGEDWIRLHDIAAYIVREYTY